ncbi:MAG: FtsX-like permease family protein [Gemmatimonadales bacterium]|nr:MAG: FtsX-like permease family protein [Gemmatimonadales bacterium]
MLLLAGLVGTAAVAAAFLLQPSLADRIGLDALAHLSVDAVPVDGLEWGDQTRGPGEAFSRAERLMHGTTAVLLLFVAAVAALGQMAFAGVVAVSRRAEMRLRRAVGAPRNRLLGELAHGAVGASGRALVVGGGAALVAHLILRAMWTASPEVATPSLGVGGPMAIGIGVAAGLLLAWAGFAFIVVQSAEVMPGAPLHAKTRLAEPFRGEVCHPGVPVLQIASVGLVLASAGVLVAGADRLWVAAPEGEGHGAERAGERAGELGDRSTFAELPRVLMRSAPGGAARAIEAVLAADSPFRAGGGGLVSVTTPGFAEGVGHLRYAQTECGVCYIPGSPPVPAPFKGEIAVHHAVSADTFRMAGIRMLEGRSFTSADGPQSEPVAIVSRGFAAEHFENGEAIGRRVRIGANRHRWHTVVGVVDALPRTRLPARTQPPEDIFVPITQLPPTRVEVMAAGMPGPSALPANMRAVASPAERDRLIAAWTTGFVRLWRGAGLAAGALAVLGIVMTVARRIREEAREIAVHRAVGATRARVVGRYLRFGLGVGAVGAGLGCWAALFAVSVLVPEGFGAPEVIALVFLRVGGGLVLVAATVATVVAAWEIRGSVREGLG